MSNEYNEAVELLKKSLKANEALAKNLKNYMKIAEGTMKEQEKTIAAQAKEIESLSKKIEQIQKIFGE